MSVVEAIAPSVPVFEAPLVRERGGISHLYGPRASGEPVRVPLSALRAGDTPRSGGIKASYVEVLAQLDGDWPPILIRASDKTIIDGHYRYVAARTLGHHDIACVYFEGGSGEAFAEAVRRNSSHGLPLTLAEREAAARRILELCADWSDRRVAELCAVAPGTVGRLRSTMPRPSGRAGQLDRRTGRDNRVRPVDPAAARARVIEAIEQNPTGSLREIARVAGSSPETVRTVRSRLAAAAAPPVEVVDLTVRPSEDRALTATTEGQRFCEWFESTSVQAEDWADHLGSIPVSRVYEVADEARRRAAAWQEFATSLETRAKQRAN